MQSIQIGKLKHDFSKILKLVQDNGETFIIEYGKKHRKVAMLVSYQEEKQKRKFSPYKNKGAFKLNNDFAMTEEELLEK